MIVHFAFHVCSASLAYIQSVKCQLTKEAVLRMCTSKTVGLRLEQQDDVSPTVSGVSATLLYIL